MELIISSLCGFSGHGTHLLTRGNEVWVLVRNLFVSFQAEEVSDGSGDRETNG
jgi:hypothetical protein